MAVAPSQDLMSRRVGEVVESTSTSFVAQCYQLDGAPPLGGLVRTDSPDNYDIYGVVSRIITEPLDSARPVLARGEEASSEEEVLLSNPQLARLLTSRMEVVIAGHGQGESLRQYLPPLPPKVHSFVYSCSAEEIARFTRSMDLLHLLLNSGSPHADEIVGACLRQTAAAHEAAENALDHTAGEFLVRACKTLAVELAGDVARLNSILRRVAP